MGVTGSNNKNIAGNGLEKKEIEYKQNCITLPPNFQSYFIFILFDTEKFIGLPFGAPEATSECEKLLEGMGVPPHAIFFSLTVIKTRYESLVSL